MTLEELQAHIKRWCEDNGTTHRALATRLCVTPETLCRWNTGRNTPSKPMLARLRRVLQVEKK
jgi:transcriptional regulator with XRE-family HTH domain